MLLEFLAILTLLCAICLSIWYWVAYRPSATQEELAQEEFEKDMGIW